MCLKATLWRVAAAMLVVMATGPTVHAQPRPEAGDAGRLPDGAVPAPDWRHIGNSAIELDLPSLATGAVSRVWYSADGSSLYAATAGSRVYSTTDQEQWTASAEAPPVSDARIASRTVPEPRAVLRDGHGGRLYGFGQHAWRSDNAGSTWTNLTAWNGHSLIGSAIADLSVSPQNPDEVAIATRAGVWHSVDGGLSWSGLNQNLPALRGRRIVSVPAGTRGFALAVDGLTQDIEWLPGEKTGWRPISSSLLAQQTQRNRTLSAALKTAVTASVDVGDFSYAGSADGRLFASSDRGRTWRLAPGNEESGPAEAIYADPKDPRLAVAVSGARIPAAPGTKVVHVRRTINGGTFWDDLTSNLPDAAVHGVAVDRASGGLYVASDAGVYFTFADLNAAGPPTQWASISRALPSAPAMDVRLDASGNQLYALIDGEGVYATIAPHRLRDARVVSAADYAARAAAPGAVLTVLGARISTARIADMPAPVLAASDLESQVQVPFEATGNSLPLAMDGGDRHFSRTVPLQTTAPAIFTDRDGAPMLVDGDTGLLLDASKPARSNTRVQILATGLGRVTPDWPTGVAAPLANAPRVNATAHAWLDRQPIEVTSATLAPGYIGMYLVEVQIPAVVNAGPAELYIDAEGHESNRVRIWIEP